MADINMFKMFFNFFLDSKDKDHCLEVYKKIMDGLKNMSDYKIITIGCQPDDCSGLERFFLDYHIPVNADNGFIIPWKYVRGSIVTSTDDTYADAKKIAEENMKEIFTYIQGIAGEKVGFVYYLCAAEYDAFVDSFDLKYYVADSLGLREIYAFDYKNYDCLDEFEDEEEDDDEYDEYETENYDELSNILGKTVEIFEAEGICVQEPCIKRMDESNLVSYKDYEMLNKTYDATSEAAVVELLIEENISSFYLLRNGFMDISKIDILPFITIPKIKSLPENSFKDFTKLEKVEFNGNRVRAIGDYCFSGCTGLKEIHLPDSLEYIGKEAFKNCTSLKEIIIPESVTDISDSAFEGCDNLRKVYLPRRK